MNIASISLANFMSHDRTDLDLPPSGIVVLTGPNGAGKSSLVEGVSFAFWGKTLRGPKPWRADDKPGFSQINCDIVRAERRRVGGLRWSSGEEITSYENTTKAQEALEEVVGSHDVWRRTSVFSSADASHFTLSTDAERKRLLEALLGLDRFDTALVACRESRSNAERSCEGYSRRLEVLATALEGWRRTAADSEAALAELPTVNDLTRLDDKAEELYAMARAAKEEISALRVRLEERRESLLKARMKSEEASKRLALFSSGHCPTCAQDVAGLSQNLKEELKRARANADSVSTRRASQDQTLEAQIEELEEERQSLVERAAAAKRESALAVESTRKRQQLQIKAKEASKKLESVEVELAELQVTSRCAAQTLLELLACEKVLGMRGVRALILGAALAGIEAAANIWLSRLAGNIKLRLTEESETKAGAAVSVIGLEIEGAGGGHGYKGASGGERRRIDVALLFALSEVAAASHGVKPGTLFVDEAFDSLDEEGVEAVVDALGEISKQRCVVVITHNEDLANALPAALRLRIEGGLHGDAALRLGADKLVALP